MKPFSAVIHGGKWLLFFTRTVNLTEPRPQASTYKPFPFKLKKNSFNVLSVPNMHPECFLIMPVEYLLQFFRHLHPVEHFPMPAYEFQCKLSIPCKIRSLFVDAYIASVTGSLFPLECIKQNLPPACIRHCKLLHYTFHASFSIS